MRKPFVWATALSLAATGLFLASCDDSKGSAPTSSESNSTTINNNGTGTSTVDYSLNITSPSNGDTTVPNATTAITIRGKVSPASGAKITVNGADANVVASGDFTSKSVNLSVGVNSIVVRLSNDTSKKETIQVIRRLDAPSITPVGYPADQRDFPDSVTLKFDAATGTTDSIRYTTNGVSSRLTSSDPKVASGTTKRIFGTTTIKAASLRSFGAGTISSDTVTIEFVVGKRVAKPYFSTPRQDSSKVAKKIAILGFGPSDTVRYTTDGGDPNETSPIYKDSILVSDSSTIIAKSFRGKNIPSPACTTTVRMIAADPVISVKSGSYTSQRYVSIKSSSGIPVYYTTDGSDPTDQSFQYTDTLLIDSNVTIKAIAARQGWRKSKVVSATYSFKVANPNLSFRTGNYDTTQLLTITDSAAGASIRYTLDGSTPTCNSTVYNPDSLLRLDSNVTVKTIACKTGWAPSEVATGSYTFKVAKILFAPDSGIYRDYQSVKLSTRSPGVSLYVTRDSTTPSWDASGAPKGSTRKIVPGDTLLITKSQWLRVAAARNGWANSVPDSRRYIIEGDTLLVDDFEQNSLTRKIGYDWRFWACGYCVNTGIPNQMEANITDTTTDWNRQIGFRHGKIDFRIPNMGAERISDGRTGPGYAGYSVGVPPDLMGETYRMVFWARWKKGDASLPDSVPMITEMSWKKNDNQNGYYRDGFHRYTEWVGSTWKRFVLDYSAFYAAGNAYMPTGLLDSTDTKPRSYWIINGYPDSARMRSMGLSKFEGEVWHSSAWKPRWVWDADHDFWVKNDITNFRWSIIQPSTEKDSIAKLTHGEWVMAPKDTVVAGGKDSVVVRPKYCGDCHQPTSPYYDEVLRGTFLKNLSGSLEIDRIQLVRRPQISGGTNIEETKKDTVATK
ncbi:MAG: chitobiase/beta-hexosaminidase C-terminal domain-containing protein [Fibrobacterota bacterium]|nr:MAG: chitobiase/beta-hexosaminidase C-terminal domain-containing protein [Fibrobacterota bacterium]